MKYGSTVTSNMQPAHLERELDRLIDDMNQDLSHNRPSSSRLSRYDLYKSYFDETKRPYGSPEQEIDRLLGETSALGQKYSSGTTSRSAGHLAADYQSELVAERPRSRFGQTWYREVPKRSATQEKEQFWYKSIGPQEGQDLLRVPTPDFTRRQSPSRRREGSHGPYGPTSIGRPLSALSRSRSGSPYSSRAASPAPSILKSTYTKDVTYTSRSQSPSHKGHVVIGPVTELIERERKIELESRGQQEYYRGRDSQTGKPLPGRHGYMTWSWPYGLNHIGDQYESQNLRLPYDSPPESKIPKIPDPPIERRAQSVEPVQVKKLPQRSRSTMSMTMPEEYLHGLHHIQVEQVPVPIPPRFGTLTYGGRYPNVAIGPYKDGPPCQLCHKAILEGRCIYAENSPYHCWHFYCSFCSKVLRDNDFIMAEDNKPYCVNCFKRMYP